MNLLIVDDQISVVEGLRSGIDWEKIGISKVFCALNAMEARTIMQHYEVDILLSDIEMPVESGLELISWIREKGRKTRCILLTAHADFNYAKESIRLGSFDYIVQPAPYHEIRQVVEKAIEDVNKSAKKEKIYNIGTIFRYQETDIVGYTLRQYLQKHKNLQECSRLMELGCLPKVNQPVYLCLLQILRWKGFRNWELSLLAMSLNNILAEIFTPYGQETILVQVEENNYAFLIWEKDYTLEKLSVIQRVDFLNNYYQNFLQCSSAMYLSGPEEWKKLPDSWQQLKNMQTDNVSLISKVYLMEDYAPKYYEYRLPQARHWAELLCGEHPQVVEEEAINFLEKMALSGKLNAQVLRDFYQDFLQVAYHAGKQGENIIHKLFCEPAEFELYRNGMRSIDYMKDLIHHVVGWFINLKNKSVTGQENLIDQVIQYIYKHLEDEIRRDELASYVYLNPDYLTRIFKKETGVSLKEYVIQVKMKEAQSLLKTTTLPVSIISAKVGYSNFSHFSFTYRKVMGISPLEERQRVEGGRKSNCER